MSGGLDSCPSGKSTRAGFDSPAVVTATLQSGRVARDPSDGAMTGARRIGQLVAWFLSQKWGEMPNQVLGSARTVVLESLMKYPAKAVEPPPPRPACLLQPPGIV